MTEHVLSIMVFCPLAGMGVVLLLPKGRHELIRWVSVLATVPPLLLAVWLSAEQHRQHDHRQGDQYAGTHQSLLQCFIHE